MKRLLSRRAVVVVAALLFVLWLLRPEAGSLRGKVARSIAQALGRNVQIGSVHLQFLPRPGFELRDLVISDAAQFGAEPLLRAPDVNASLRLRSLLRGHIEISNLSLSEASVNLTRDAQGKWNFEDLIERTSRTALAPTSQARSSGAAFPYIEATRARVNFKVGAEKIHFAFTDAEFSLWEESADTWGARLRARPIRTDANLTDTGVISLSGIWRRSASAQQTPLQAWFQWNQAQIGQVSKLFYGTDKGWRGGVLFSGTVSGTPESLALTADTSVADFRAQNVIGGGSLNLAAHCSAEYDPANRALSNVDCQSSSGNGLFQVKGGVGGVLQNGRLFSTSHLWLVATKLPADGLLSLANHLRSGLPESLSARGSLSLSVEMTRGDASEWPVFRGNGSVEDLVIGNNDVSEVALNTIPLQFVSAAPETSKPSPRNRHQQLTTSEHNPTTFSILQIGPVNVAARPRELMTQAAVTLDGYRLVAQGTAGLTRILQIAKAFAIPSPTVAADGDATVKLAVSGAWDGGRPQVEGSAHLHSVRAQITGLSVPIEITDADLAISPSIVRIQNLSARAAAAVWHGSIEVPRPCPTPADCELQFNVHTAALDVAAANELVNPAEHKGPWYNFFSLGRGQAPYLLRARASGKISIDKLELGSSSCTHFTSDLSFDSGTISLANFRGQFLGGAVIGNWSADFTSTPPAYKGTGKLQGVSLAPVASWMHDGWIDGTGSASYKFQTSGATLQDALASADLDADFALQDGIFSHIVLVGHPSALRASTFSGSLGMHDGVISFHDAKLESDGQVYNISGTASLKGGLNVKAMTENASGFSVTGTLLKTRVSSIPSTEASLKP